MSGGYVSDIEWVFGGIDALFPTFEKAFAQHSLDYVAGKLDDAEQLRLRQWAAGLEGGSDPLRLFVEDRRGSRVFWVCMYIFPGNYTLCLGFSPQHRFANFD